MKRAKLSILLLCTLYGHTNYACSLFAYIGSLLCKAEVLKGLARQEFRGYDAAGFACYDMIQHNIVTIKKMGKVEELEKAALEVPYDGYIGIGHTRWATHGQATIYNAHPHTSNDKSFVMVHNGVIENFFPIKQELIAQGYQFSSETDSEVIAHLFDRAYKQSFDLKAAALETVNQLHGACTFIGLHKDHPTTLIIARQRSPLCVGITADGIRIASDFLAFADKTDTVYFMPDRSVALVTSTSLTVYDYAGKQLTITPQKVPLQPYAYQKLDHEHYMLKEIYEQKEAISKTVTYLQKLHDNVWPTLGITEDLIQHIETVHLFGCAASSHAAHIGQFFFEQFAQLPGVANISSELRHRLLPHPNTLYLALSQSGERADTLELVRSLNHVNAPTFAITNVETSSLMREAHGALLTKAGPELAVAATKTFVTQLATLYWLAHRIALARGMITIEQLHQAEQDLCNAADILEQTLEDHKVALIKGASNYAKAHQMIYTGRHITYPLALEGALKLKEISYIFAEGYAAGELKHGTITLVDEQTPIVLFSHQDPAIYQKLVGNAQEVKARKGHLIVFAFAGQDELIALADTLFIIPRVAPLLEPIAMAGVMQFFAYQVALVLGRDIDRPRNLAKTLTIEA